MINSIVNKTFDAMYDGRDLTSLQVLTNKSFDGTQFFGQFEWAHGSADTREQPPNPDAVANRLQTLLRPPCDKPRRIGEASENSD